MNKTLTVDCINSSKNLMRNVSYLLNRERVLFLFDEILEGAIFIIIHDEINMVLTLVNFSQRSDVRKLRTRPVDFYLFSNTIRSFLAIIEIKLTFFRGKFFDSKIFTWLL